MLVVYDLKSVITLRPAALGSILGILKGVLFFLLRFIDSTASNSGHRLDKLI